MRLTSLLLIRRPQDINKVPFKATEPLTLKNRVSGKGQRMFEQGCLYEMSLLLTCLEENNFENKLCIPQIKALDSCYQNYKESVQRQQVAQEQHELIPNNKNCTHIQITNLLRKYPTV